MLVVTALVTREVVTAFAGLNVYMSALCALCARYVQQTAYVLQIVGI